MYLKILLGAVDYQRLTLVFFAKKKTTKITQLSLIINLDTVGFVGCHLQAPFYTRTPFNRELYQRVTVTNVPVVTCFSIDDNLVPCIRKPLRDYFANILDDRRKLQISLKIEISRQNLWYCL